MKIKSKIIFTSIVSILFGVAISFSCNIVYGGNVSYSLDQTYIKFDATSILWGLLAAFLFFAIVMLADKYKEKISTFLASTHFAKKSLSPKTVFFITFGIIVLAWMPYLLSFYPGSVLEDSIASLEPGALHSNHHPILYSFILQACAKIGKLLGDVNIGIFIYTCIQYLVLALSCSFIVAALRSTKFKWPIIAIAILFFAICPVFPAYAIIAWKDPLFSVCVLWVSILLPFVVAVQQNNKITKIKRRILIAAYCVSILGMCFLRNNGTFMLAIVTAALLFVVRWKFVTKVTTILLALVLVIQGPIFLAFHIKTSPGEALGIPIQQIAYTACTEEVTPEQAEQLEHFITIADCKNTYTPCIADSIKFSPCFNSKYLSSHVIDFAKLWLSLLPGHLGAYIKAYALETFGYWDPAATDPYGYADIYITENDMGIHNTDIVEILTGTSIKSALENLLPSIENPDRGFAISSGLLFCLIVAGFTMCVLQKDKNKCLFYAPILSCWAVIMIATPVAFSLRYVFCFMLVLPLALLLPFAKTQQSLFSQALTK